MTVTAMAGAQSEAPARNARPLLRAAAKFGDFVVACVEHGRARLDSDSHLFARSPEMARVVVVLGGKVRLACAGAAATLGARDAALLQPGVGVTYSSDGPARVLLCDLPSSLPGLAALPAAVPYAVGRGSIGVPSALGAFLIELLRQDVRGISPAGRKEVTDVLTTLVSSTVTTLAVTGSASWEPEQRRQAALRVIAAHFMDPDLTSQSVAQRLGLSRRTLQRLFEDDDRSVKQHIHDVRTQYAIARIQDPRYAHTTLEEIATLAGFGSVVGLRRAVAEATGLAPSALRARVALPAVA